MEPFFLHAHDLGVALGLAGGDVDTQISQVRKNLLELSLSEHVTVGTHRHRNSQLASSLDAIDENGRKRALAIRDEADSLYSDLSAVIEKIENGFLANGDSIVFLHH